MFKLFWTMFSLSAPERFHNFLQKFVTILARHNKIGALFLEFNSYEDTF